MLIKKQVYIDRNLPVLLSPASLRSELVFVYEKPTPAGDSRNRIFAAIFPNKLKLILINNIIIVNQK